MYNNPSFYSFSEAGSAPKIMTEGEYLKEVHNQPGGLQGAIDEGKKVLKFSIDPTIKFAAGETTNADITELQATAVMATLDSAFIPAMQDKDLQKLCNVIPVTEKVVDFSVLLGGGEDMREWIGPRVSNRLRSDKVTATTQKWELTYDIEREAFEDDSTGTLARRIALMANNVQARRLDRVVDMYVNGETAVHWLDGQNVIDTDHTYTALGGYATNISNEESTAASAAQWRAAWAAFQLQFDYNGNSETTHVPTHILVSPSVYDSAIEVFVAPFFNAGAATAGGDAGTGYNAMRGRIQPDNIVSHPGVTAGDGFFIRNTGLGDAPVIMATRSDVPDEFIIKTNADASDEVYRNDMYSFGYRGRDTLIYGHWRNLRLAVD